MPQDPPSFPEHLSLLSSHHDHLQAPVHLLQLHQGSCGIGSGSSCGSSVLAGGSLVAMVASSLATRSSPCRTSMTAWCAPWRRPTWSWR
uniref:Uncharacterized protein n=1 Tax=Phocoena sinus TaxID=42100 RepID=A0A8C9CHF6_PHOSS